MRHGGLQVIALHMWQLRAPGLKGPGPEAELHPLLRCSPGRAPCPFCHAALVEEAIQGQGDGTGTLLLEERSTHVWGVMF